MSENKVKLYQDIKSAKEKIQAIRNELKLVLSETFSTVAKEDLFDKYPKLYQFGWSQYTPYFNDGEECTFEVNYRWPVINNHDDYREEELNIPEEFILTDEEYKEIKPIVIKFLAQFTTEDFEDLFGDHVKVLVTREGVEVTEYDHE